MTLALGLGVTFVGAVFVLAGYTDRPIGRLLFGYWDAPGSKDSAAPATAPKAGTAATGGVYARPTSPAGTTPVGGPR